MNEPDAQLVARCLAADASAMAALHGAHARSVAAYFLRSGFAPADAEDLAQEVFIRAFKSLGTYDAAKGSLRGWLAAIARNVARRHWQRPRDPEHFDPDLAAEVLAGGENPRLSAQAREEIDAVRDCVGRLEGDLAALVRLRYVEARTTRGIAAATHLPESTVRLRLSEAARRLEQCLKGKGIVKD